MRSSTKVIAQVSWCGFVNIIFGIKYLIIMKTLNQFKKHEINHANKINAGGISTSYESSVTGAKCTDTWYMFKKNNTTTVDLEGNPDGRVDYGPCG